MSRILITGGSGRLGSAIRRVCREQLLSCCAPASGELDVLVFEGCDRAVALVNPDIIVHCAAYVSAIKAEQDREACWAVNVEGTRNMVRAAAGRRFVYISTEYVFDGEEGNYSETDPPNPINFYGVSKLAGEMVASEHENTLILRAAFRADAPWRFPRAFTDQWTSCRFASEAAPDVVAAALSDETGVLHIGGPRRSIWEMANVATPGVAKCSRKEFPELRIPRDTSLNSAKWQTLRASREAVCESAR